MSKHDIWEVIKRVIISIVLPVCIGYAFSNNWVTFLLVSTIYTILVLLWLSRK